LSVTTKIKIDGSLTRLSTKEQLDKSKVGEIYSFEGTTEQDKADRDHVLLKLT